MGGQNQGLTYPAVIDALLEFLEVAIHLILFLRNVYPVAWFERVLKYKMTVWQSRHPDLKNYIQDILNTLRPDLEKGIIRQVHCVVVDDVTKIPVETFTFQMKSLLKGATEDMKKTTLTSISSGDIEQHLKAFIAKLFTCEALLAPNPPDCSFYLAMDLEDEVEPSTLTAGTGEWIPVDDKARVHNASMVPLKSIDTGVFKMQLFVEEGLKST